MWRHTVTHGRGSRKVAVHFGYGRVRLKCDGTRWRTGGKVRKVAVHFGYGRVQLKCDITRWRTGEEFRKVAVHLGYGRVQLECEGTRWRTGGEVRKVAVHLQKVMEVMSTSVYTGLNAINFIRNHISTGLYRSQSAQRLSERRCIMYVIVRLY